MTVRRLPRDYITRAYADDGGPACDAPRSVNSPPGRQRLDIGSDDLDPLCLGAEELAQEERRRRNGTTSQRLLRMIASIARTICFMRAKLPNG
jgi:hypothetical protein